VSGEIIEEIKKYIVNARKKVRWRELNLEKRKQVYFLVYTLLIMSNGKEIPIWITDFVLANYGTGRFRDVRGTTKETGTLLRNTGYRFHK